MRFPTLFSLGLLWLLAGCASYQMGAPSALPYSSIEVASPRNESTLPQIEAPLSVALRQAIQESQSLRLDSNGGSAVLEITVLEAKRDIAAALAEDVGRARKFELTLNLALSLRKPGAGDEYFFRDRLFSVTQDIYTDSGQITAEYQATPEIARVIAVRATEILEDLW